MREGNRGRAARWDFGGRLGRGRRRAGYLQIKAIVEGLEPRVLLSGLTGTGTSIQAIAGTLLDVGDIDGSGSIYVPAGVSVAVDEVNEGSLDVAGELALSSADSPTNRSRTSTVDSLTISGSGVLDVGDNELIIDYAAGSDPVSTIRGYLISGRNGGGWNGTGIISSSAQTPTFGHYYALGYADGADGKIFGLASGQLEIRYTLMGDANLDGIVNGTDFDMTGNFGASVTGWDEGDFDYTGVFTGSDFSALSANFGQGSIISPAESYTAPPQYVATFTDAANTPLSDLTASIDWGDSSTPTAGAIVSDGNGTFHVLANHVYGQVGTYQVTTTITDSSSNSTTEVESTAVVSPAALTATPLDAYDIQVLWPALPILSSGETLLISTDPNFQTNVTTENLSPGVTDFVASNLSPSTAYYFELLPAGTGMPAVGFTSAATDPSDGNGGTSGPTAPTISQAATSSQPSNTTLSLTMTAASGSDPIDYSWQLISGPGGTPPEFTNSEQTTDVILSAAGNYDFRCTATDDDTGLAVASDVSVDVNQVATSISVTPGSAEIAPSAERQFSAVENDQFGNAMSSQPAFSWSVTNTSLGNIFEYPGNQVWFEATTWTTGTLGLTAVQASAGGLTGNAPVMVSGALAFPFENTDSFGGASFSGPSTPVAGNYPLYNGTISLLVVPNGGDALNSQGLSINFATPVSFLPTNQSYLTDFSLWGTSRASEPPNGTVVGNITVDTFGSYAGTVDLVSESTPSFDGYGAGVDLSSFVGITGLQINLGSNPSNGQVYPFAVSDLLFEPMTLGITLADGSPNQVLSASNDGTQNLKPLQLFLPQNADIYDASWNLPSGTELTLSTSAANEVDVWNSQNPQAGSTPLLGGSGQTSSVSWTVGTDTIPSTLWVGATQGSADIANIVFTLAITAPGASSPATQGSTEPVPSDPPVQIKLSADPNNSNLVGQDLSNQNVQWVVGQIVDLQADAPGATSYVWTIGGNGNPLADWTITPATNTSSGHASPVQVVQNNQNTQMGTHDQSLQFFWLNPGVFTVTLKVTFADGQSQNKQTTFIVSAPTASFSGMPTTTQPPVLIESNFRTDPITGQFIQVLSFGDGNSPGMTFNGSVTTPAGATQAGSFEVIQLADVNFTLTNLNGVVVNDSTPGYVQDDDPNYDIPYGGATVSIGNNAMATLNPNRENDTPNIPTSPYEKIVVNNSYRTYLMYQPTGGQWVPLLEFNWSWSGTATLNNGAWQPPAQTASPAGVVTGQAVTSEPGWSDDYQSWSAAAGI